MRCFKEVTSFAGTGDPLDVFRTNLFGTDHLLKACVEYAPNVKKVILASTANVYGRQEEEKLAETICPQPVNYYGSSKLAMEHMALTYSEKLPITIVRPFNCIGRGQDIKFLVPKIVWHFQQGKELIELGNIDVFRDFLDVRIASSAYRRLLGVKSSGMTLNLCSGRLTSLREIVDLIADISGRDIEINVNPEFVRENEILRLCGDNSRLINLIGGLGDISLKETLKWILGSHPSSMTAA